MTLQPTTNSPSPALSTTNSSPTLILLPGLHGTSELYTHLRAHIPPTIPTRSIDYPRHRITSSKQLLQQLHADLHSEQNMLLIAESFSGPLALQFAQANSHRVRGIVLCVSFIKPPVPRIFCYLGAPIAFLKTPIPRWAIHLFLAGSGASRTLVTEVKRVIHGVSSRVIAHRVFMMSLTNATEALRTCPVPLLCLAGSRDRLVGPRSTRRIHRIRPDIPIRRFDAPHLLLQLQPAQAWREISMFIDQI